MQRVFLNVGYELSERQLRAHFTTYGVLSDLYLPKHTNGRNKGYGFATFASEHSLSLVLQQPKHVINGITVQVKRAGPRPPDVLKDLKPVTPQKIEAVPPFGKGPRLYVGGVPDPVSESRVREHFAKWGSVSDVYFPGARGPKRLNYCFVTFDNQLSAECACSESDRNLDGWPVESITMAADRNDRLHPEGHRPISAIRPGHLSAAMTSDMPQAAGFDAASFSSYLAWLQLQHQQQLAAVMASMSAGNQPTQFAQANAQFAATSALMVTAPAKGVSNPYSQANNDSLLSNQQWVGTPQPSFHCPVPQAGQYQAHTDGAGIGGRTRGSMQEDLDQLKLLAQHSMFRAAEDHLHRQGVTDHGMRPDQFGNAAAASAGYSVGISSSSYIPQF